MDKNQVTGLILVSALLLIYIQFFAPKPEELQPSPEDIEQVENQIEASQPQNRVSEEIISEDLPDSLVDQKLQQQYGVFHTAAKGEKREYVIENNEVEIILSSKGGFIKQARLKDFKTSDKEPLILLDEESSDYSFFINSKGKKVNLSDLYFKEVNTNTINDTSFVTLTADLGNGRRITQKYLLPSKGYLVQYSIEFTGLDSEIDRQNHEIVWNKDIKHLESSLETSRQNATINYFTQSSEFDDLSETSTGLEEVTISEKISWATFKQRFFTVGIIPSAGFEGAYFKTFVNSNDSTTVKEAQMVLSVPSNTASNNFTLYFGPNNYQILKKVTEGFSRNVNLGWGLFSWFNKFLIIPVFNFLENYISNYGIIILILVIIIKLLLFPLSYSSYKSFAKQRVLKPEIDKLKEEFGDDMQKMQQAQMKLFQQVGINPLSGCIPLILQMPILFAMFNFFPNSVELRQEGFLWAHDFSTYDSILDLPFEIPFYGAHVSLFTLLMTATTILTQRMNSQMQASAMQGQGPLKAMMYIMPIMFMFVLNSFSSGLTYYYFVANLITIGQQSLIKKFIDEDKIRQILDENRKKNKNKKKSKWQLRVEEAMKASQEAKNKGSKRK